MGLPDSEVSLSDLLVTKQIAAGFRGRKESAWGFTAADIVALGGASGAEGVETRFQPGQRHRRLIGTRSDSLLMPQHVPDVHAAGSRQIWQEPKS